MDTIALVKNRSQEFNEFIIILSKRLYIYKRNNLALRNFFNLLKRL